MLKKLIVILGRKKNPLFTLDESVSNGMLFNFLIRKIFSFIRGLRLGLNVSSNHFILLGKNVKIRGKKKFSFGKAVQIDENVQIIAYGKQGLFMDDNSWIGSNSVIKVSFSFNTPGKFIRVGKNVGIGEFAHLGGAGGLTIADDCIIGPYFSCHPENHLFHDNDKLIRHQELSRKGIYINSNCWIGAKVTILDGVTIGENCVIAAGAVVTKDMPSNSVIGGVPAKVIRSRDSFYNNISMKIAG